MRRWATCVAALAAVGCSGLRFGSVPVNEELPEDWKNRNLYHNTAHFKYQLQDLAGSLLQKKEGEKEFTRIGRQVAPGYVPALKVIDDGKVYESKVDRGAEVQGSYLAWVAKLQGNQKAGVLIQDVSSVFIPYPDIPWKELAKLAVANPPQPGVQRFYVQGALLSSIVIEKYMEIEASASGVMGPAVGIGGKVYARQGSVSRDFRIALELIDIDKLNREILASAEKSPEAWADKCLKMTLLEYDETLRRLRAAKVEIEDIR